jgi:hypothetical protein
MTEVLADSEEVVHYRELYYQVIKAVDNQTMFEILSQACSFVKQLREKHGRRNVVKCQMYHRTLAGSTIPLYLKDEIFLDFEGEDSIRLFINQLANQFLR